jgi:hypothetical protein
MTDDFVLKDGHSDTAPVSGLKKIQDEIDSYMEEMQKFQQMEPSEVFLSLSAWSARATELKIQLSRTEGQKSRKLLVNEIEPFLSECERQFRYHSRFHATRDMEFRLSGGQT